MRGNWHNAGVLIAYMPEDRLLIQADRIGAPTA